MFFFRHTYIQLNNHYSTATINSSYAHCYFMKHLSTDNGLITKKFEKETKKMWETQKYILLNKLETFSYFYLINNMNQYESQQQDVINEFLKSRNEFL